MKVTVHFHPRSGRLHRRCRGAASQISMGMKVRGHIGESSLAPRVLRQVSFDYVKKQNPSWQRAIAYYEYARESATLREKVESVREQLRRGRLSRSQRDVLVIRETETWMPMEIAFLLVPMRSFPSKAFALSDVPSDLVEGIASSGIGLERIAFVPWDVFFEMQKLLNIVERRKQVELSNVWNSANQTIHALLIPWNSTDRSLAKEFRDLLKEHRPASTPEPRKRGRKGASLSVSPIEMLHQLAAYRFEKMGYSYAKAHHLTVYTSQRGWRDAITSARQRISTLATEPLFGSSTRRQK
jgi:hypothetical protein